MTLTKRIFNNVFWMGLGEISSRGLFFLGNIYLARILGKTEYGLFSYSITLGLYFWVVADMGIALYGTREIARNKTRVSEIFVSLNSLKIVLSVILIVIFATVLTLVEMPVNRKLTLLAGACYAVTYSLSAEWVLRGLEQMKYYCLGRIASSLLFIAGLYVLVESSSDTLRASVLYSLSYLFGSILFIGILWNKYAIKFSFRISFKDWWEHIKESVFFAINGIYNSVTLFIPIFFMGLWNTDMDIGIFSASQRVVLLIVNSGALVILALYPTLSNLYTLDKMNFDKTYSRFQKLISAVLMPICIILSVSGRDIIEVLYGSTYAESGSIFNILVWFSLFAILRRSAGSTLFSSGYQRLNIYATSCGTAVIIVMSMALIPNYRAYGATCALITGEMLTLLLMSGFIKKKVYQSDHFLKYNLKVILAGTIMGLVILNLPYPDVIRVLIGILVYVLLSLAVGIISFKSVKKFYLNITKNEVIR